MRQTTRLKFQSTISQDDQEALLAALTASGIIVDPAMTRGSSLSIVVLEAIDSDILDLIEVASRECSLLLAIAIPLHTLKIPDFWSLQRAGASDVLIVQDISDLVSQIVARVIRWRAVLEIMEKSRALARLVGKSRIWQQFQRQIVEIAAFSSSTVTIIG